jgi:hypothetical protein
LQQQQQPICSKPIATKSIWKQTHDTLSDDDAAAAPGVQFNLNDQVFQIFDFLFPAKDPVTLLRSSQK